MAIEMECNWIVLVSGANFEDKGKFISYDKGVGDKDIEGGL